MMPLLRLRPRARADLSDIWDYTVAEWSEQQAQTYLTGMDAVFRLILEFPEIARKRAEFNPPVRLHAYRRHLIVYQVDEAGIDVIRILHNRSNWADLLSEQGT